MSSRCGTIKIPPCSQDISAERRHYSWQLFPCSSDVPLCVIYTSKRKKTIYNQSTTVAMTQWVRALALQAEGWAFESEPRQTLVVKTDSDLSAAKRSAIGVSFTGPRRWPLYTDDSRHSRRGTLKNPHCSMAMSAEHRAKICSPSPVMVTFPYEWKMLEWDDKFQTNKHTKINQLIQACVCKNSNQNKPLSKWIYTRKDMAKMAFYTLSCHDRICNKLLCN